MTPETKEKLREALEDGRGANLVHSTGATRDYWEGHYTEALALLDAEPTTEDETLEWARPPR